MNTHVVEVKNLTKKFGDFNAVDNISFELKEGEILGFLGVNGAGKTTTIQMLLGVLTPTAGEITFFGKNLKEHRSDIMEKVNFSSTYIELPWNLTVEENLRYISLFYDIPNRKERIKRIIEIFGLEPMLKKEMRKLSEGQKTRVNLSKAFINFPKILLLDEPTASLDVEIAAEIRQFLLKERQEFQTSMLLTSHNMAEVEEVCDRVIFINAGKIIADDSPENLAKTIQIAHVSLLAHKQFKNLIEYCQKMQLAHSTRGHYITVDIHEKEIPKLLFGLANQNITYEEISIEKPTLEDYFLQVVAKDNYEN